MEILSMAMVVQTHAKLNHFIIIQGSLQFVFGDVETKYMNHCTENNVTMEILLRKMAVQTHVSLLFIGIVQWILQTKFQFVHMSLSAEMER